jgi:beta-aspartyl-peptidase (threonine type)
MSSDNLKKTEHFKNVVLAVHGGAGAISRENLSEQAEAEYLSHLHAALTIGFQLLSEGATSVDAVEATVRYFEDCPLFNAGRGAVFTCDGKNELDAAIMNGKNLAAGSIAAVHTIKNPITAARAVMEQTPHVMLVGKGAERFAAEAGLEIVDNSYFFTQTRFDQLKEVQNAEAKHHHERPVLDGKNKYGTVGAVARDKDDNLAVATSTGGVTNKLYGRVGDSPIIGGGTYADNYGCAVSATGQGEYFMRRVAAHSVSSLIRLKSVPLVEAATDVIASINELGGHGGLIALDAEGNCALPFNTAGMFRGCVTADGNIYTAIFGN